MKNALYGVVAILGCLAFSEAKLREGDCDVCIKFLTKFEKSVANLQPRTPASIKARLVASCKTAKGKDNRFCYYIGATDNAPTGIVNEVTNPMEHHVPAEKICEKLKSKDSQICELQYEQKIDIKGQDLKKMRVKQLRKILQSWDEECPGCIEKTDFVDRIEELKHKHLEL